MELLAIIILVVLLFSRSEKKQAESIQQAESSLIDMKDGSYYCKN